MFSLNKHEKALEYEIFVKKEYSILDEIIKNSKLIFDIWSHIWLFSKYSLQLNNKLKIHCFEPIFSNFEKSKFILENSKENIIFNNLWVSAVCWKKEIFFNETKTMQSSIFNNTFLNKTWESFLVNFINLDDYIEKNNILQIDLLKIDIEWAEFEVLLNFKSFQKVKVLFFESHIFNDKMQKDYDLLLRKLKNIYKNIDIFESEYSSRIWYILAF